MPQRPQWIGEAGTNAPVEPELATPIDVFTPAPVRSPLVLSCPHSGRIYPRRFLNASRLDPATLRRSEDAFVDDLFTPAAESLGAPLVRAHFPRAFLDVNREPYELDPRMFEGRLPSQANTRSLRVAGGLGTIARIVGESQEIYARKMPVADALARIDGLYRPYHAALRRLIQQAHAAFGLAVVIDCHSMPSVMTAAGRAEPLHVDVVLGDRFGASCHPSLVEAAEAELKRRGYRVQRNKPYAGGFITEHYGAPGARAHALQIEINRKLYLDEIHLEKRETFPRLAQDMRAAAEAVAGQARALAHRAAAE